MISKDAARRIAAAHLEASCENADFRPVILDEHTIERPFGWVFFYDSDVHLRTGSVSDALAGNAPIIVDKRDGSLRITGTAYPIEWYIENYEQYGSPYPPEGVEREHPGATRGKR